MQKTAFLFMPAIFVLLLTSLGNAQSRVFPTPTPSPSPRPTSEPRVTTCPQLSVQAQGGQRIRDGQPVAFSVNLAGGDPRILPTILWSISAGVISRGEFTRNIVVDSTGAGSTPDREIKADVWVGGYAPECVLQASTTVKVTGPAVKLGEFGLVPDETLKTNLKTVVNILSQTPDNLWLIVYAGRNSERGFAFTWTKRIKDELIANGVSARRVSAVDGGYREEPLFDFWTVPIGAEPPRPAPTIDRREIILKSKVPPATKPK